MFDLLLAQTEWEGVFCALAAVHVFCAIAGGIVGECHGRNFTGSLLGLFFGPFGLIAAACLPDTAKRRLDFEDELAAERRRRAAAPEQPTAIERAMHSAGATVGHLAGTARRTPAAQAPSADPVSPAQPKPPTDTPADDPDQADFERFRREHG